MKYSVTLQTHAVGKVVTALFILYGYTGGELGHAVRE